MPVVEWTVDQSESECLELRALAPVKEDAKVLCCDEIARALVSMRLHSNSGEGERTCKVADRRRGIRTATWYRVNEAADLGTVALEELLTRRDLAVKGLLVVLDEPSIAGDVGLLPGACLCPSLLEILDVRSTRQVDLAEPYVGDIHAEEVPRVFLENSAKPLVDHIEIIYWRPALHRS